MDSWFLQITAVLCSLFPLGDFISYQGIKWTLHKILKQFWFIKILKIFQQLGAIPPDLRLMEPPSSKIPGYAPDISITIHAFNYLEQTR